MQNSIATKLCSFICCIFSFLIYLPATAQTAYYSGYVYDNATQQPIVQTRIIITNLDSNNRILLNTTSGSDGSYFLNYRGIASMKISASLAGYVSYEISYTRSQVASFAKKFPPIYLEKLPPQQPAPDRVVPPVSTAPVSKATTQFIADKLKDADIVPSSGAYELIYYLNPGLKERGSILSNEKIILPNIPHVSGAVIRNNKSQFKNDAYKDNMVQAKVLESVNNLKQTISISLSNYKMNYRGVDPDSVSRMQTYLTYDLTGYDKYSKYTTRLKAEKMIPLLNEFNVAFSSMISRRSVNADEFNNLKAIWEDLSELLSGAGYQIFILRKEKLTSSFSRMPVADKSVGHGPAVYWDNGSAITVPETPTENTTAGFEPKPNDEVGVFGFVIWDDNTNSAADLGRLDLKYRYIIKYFTPFFKKDTASYKNCIGMANVAIANLVRGRYGVEVYDNTKHKYLTLFDQFVKTDEGLIKSGWEDVFVRDFKIV